MTTWTSQHQKGKQFWILMKLDMMLWQWHQLDHMQIICNTLQTDNHASTTQFLQDRCPPDTQQQHQSTAGTKLL